MKDTDDLIREMVRNHNNDIDCLAAWCLGCIATLERDINQVRVSLGCDEMPTLNDLLHISIQNRDVAKRNGLEDEISI